MPTIRFLARGERRARKYDLPLAQRAFAEVSAEWFAGPPILQFVFGSLYFEMPEPLACDFGTRIARAMRHGFRCASGMSRADRDYAEVLLQKRDNCTRLRLEFADGNTADFSVTMDTCFADRIRRVVTVLPAPATLAA